MSLPTAIKASPRRAGWRELALFFAMVALVFVTRLPYLDAGYGVDADAWRSANTITHFAQTGDYRISRFPGFLYYEIPAALVASGGAFAIHGVSALMAGVAAGFVALILREFGSRDYLLGAFAFASIPAVFIYSTWSQDYVWSMAFIVAGFYALLRRRYVSAGLCLGVAIGSRLTSGGMLIPLSLFLWLEERARLRPLLIFNLSAGLLGGFAYLLIISKYGISAIQYIAYG